MPQSALAGCKSTTMYDTVCTYPLSSELFAQAIHPSEPLVSIGLASGHVQTIRLPPAKLYQDEDHPENSVLSDGCGTIETLWRTRRHKGSCRSLVFSTDGTKLFSAGTDGLVKMAATETGQVESKIAVPLASLTNKPDTPSLVYTLSPQALILGTDSAAMHIYDLRENTSVISVQPQYTEFPHADYVSSITPLPASDTSTSGFPKQWLSTGGTTVAITDVRRGVMVKSEDQGEELLSSCYVNNLPRRRSGPVEKMLVGGAGGVITLWEKGVWGDQDSRIIVDAGKGGGESIETIVKVPDSLGSYTVASGMGNGAIRFSNLVSQELMGGIVHDELEGVVGLGYDCSNRLVSGGGQTLKVWEEAFLDGDADDAHDLESASKRMLGASEDTGDDSDSDSDKEVESSKHKHKKRKTKGKGKTKTSGKQKGIYFKDLG